MCGLKPTIRIPTTTTPYVLQNPECGSHQQKHADTYRQQERLLRHPQHLQRASQPAQGPGRTVRQQASVQQSQMRQRQEWERPQGRPQGRLVRPRPWPAEPQPWGQQRQDAQRCLWAQPWGRPRCSPCCEHPLTHNTRRHMLREGRGTRVEDEDGGGKGKVGQQATLHIIAGKNTTHEVPLSGTRSPSSTLTGTRAVLCTMCKPTPFHSPYIKPSAATWCPCTSTLPSFPLPYPILYLGAPYALEE
jgi:hypothetical protein